VCTPAGPGVANCSCLEGFGGDGYHCYSTIGREISTIAQLSSLNQLLQVLAQLFSLVFVDLACSNGPLFSSGCDLKSAELMSSLGQLLLSSSSANFY